jgi:predicted transposase YdaD
MRDDIAFEGYVGVTQMPLSVWYERRSIQKDKERYEAGFKDGEKRGEIRGREKGVEEGRRLERDRLLAELASQSNGDVGDQH